jgi:hypothetical protein
MTKSWCMGAMGARAGFVGGDQATEEGTQHRVVPDRDR